MQLPDIINACFEAGGSVFAFFSILKLYREKEVKGFSYWTSGFFSAFGYWNLYYYYHLQQWVSWGAAGFLGFMNMVWTLQAIYYSYLERTTTKLYMENLRNGTNIVIRGVDSHGRPYEILGDGTETYGLFAGWFKWLKR